MWVALPLGPQADITGPQCPPSPAGRSVSVLFNFLKMYLFHFMCGCLACMRDCALCVCLVPEEVRRQHWIPGTGVLYRFPESNPGPLQKTSGLNC